jgi:pantetheine-phosphate adenylyltransferase
MAASPRIAIYPGSFDPPTYGHLDVISRASRLFDRVVVAVLTNTSKQSSFSVEERVTMMRELLAEHASVDVDGFQGLLVDYARRREAVAIVRGIRNGTDFDYEQQMAGMNRHLDGAIETVFLAPSAAHAHISSTLVREIAALGGSVRGLVPPAVEARIERRRDKSSSRQA